jgi:hypothetical protein
MRRSSVGGRVIKMALTQINYKNVRTEVGREVTVKVNIFWNSGT